MIFVDAVRAIQDAYDVKYSLCWQVGDAGQAPVALRKYCPLCHSHMVIDLGRKPVKDEYGEKVLDAQGRVKERQQYRCGGCKKTFHRPLMMTPRRSARADRRARTADSGYRICNAIEVGEVRSVVEGLHPVETLWLLYVYTDAVKPDAAENLLHDYLCQCLDADPPCDLEGLGALKKALHLLLIVIKESRRTYNGGHSPWSIAKIADKVFANEEGANHQVKFQPGRPWRCLLDSSRHWLAELNLNAITPVDELVARLRGDRRDVG